MGLEEEVEAERLIGVNCSESEEDFEAAPLSSLS